MIRMLIVLGGLSIGLFGLSATPATADGTLTPIRSPSLKTSLTSGPTAPCTPYACPARQSTTWAHSVGFGAAVGGAVLIARRDRKLLRAQH